MNEASQDLLKLKAEVYDLLVESETRQVEIQQIQERVNLLTSKIKGLTNVIPDQSS